MGFKEGYSTQNNLSYVIQNILASSKRPTQRVILIIFDICKAFDSVTESSFGICSPNDVPTTLIV